MASPLYQASLASFALAHDPAAASAAAAVDTAPCVAAAAAHVPGPVAELVVEPASAVSSPRSVERHHHPFVVVAAADGLAASGASFPGLV